MNVTFFRQNTIVMDENSETYHTSSDGNNESQFSNINYI